MKALSVQESVADIDGIDSFCSHMGSVLKQLPPGLRVEAKTKLFNVLAEFELKSLDQSSRTRNISFSTDSNQSYPISNSSASNLTPYSPISVPSPPAEAADLSTRSVYEEYDDNNFFSL